MLRMKLPPGSTTTATSTSISTTMMTTISPRPKIAQRRPLVSSALRPMEPNTPLLSMISAGMAALQRMSSMIPGTNSAIEPRNTIKAVQMLMRKSFHQCFQPWPSISPTPAFLPLRSATTP